MTAHVGAGVHQAAAHLDGLVGGDAAGDPEDDTAPGERAHCGDQPITSGAPSPTTASNERELELLRQVAAGDRALSKSCT